jgi:hypothetical protein
MPIHNWSLVGAGAFHDFHCGWIVEIRNALNNGVLPPDYDAKAEQLAGAMQADVLALERIEGSGDAAGGGEVAGATVVAFAPPKVRYTATTEMDEYVLKQRTLVIRHSSDDRIVALIEIISPGNKSSRHGFQAFLSKAADALARGYHWLLVDLVAPGPRDPHGIHGALWDEIAEPSYRAPADKPLTLAAYSAGRPTTAYVEPVAIGETLPDMPLFLEPEAYVYVPLEATYQAAMRGVPKRWRDVLQPSA